MRSKVRTINVPGCWTELEFRPGGFNLVACRWNGPEKVRVVVQLDDYQAEEISDHLWRVVQRREKEAAKLRRGLATEPEPTP